MSDLNIFVTSNLTSSERRISPQWNLHYMKQKLELITGIQPQNQVLQYYPNQHSNEYTIILDSSNYDEASDSQTLVSSLGLKLYSRIHVLDTDPDSAVNALDGNADETDATAGGGSGLGILEEEYAKRSDTVLQWKQTNQLGRFNPEYTTMQAKVESENAARLLGMRVGQRCRIINIAGERRGVVKYIGRIESLDAGKDTWVGVEFDEPVGKNDGFIDGVKVFECRRGHGSFVRPKQVEVGDFPELDPFAGDDDEDMDEEL
ncbi:Cell polarity protein alp11 [Candida viswanathii]|uniref:Cell polarity protein alp11 n=1 Tax=Candida viswanathii TaxID=5486 RepID=A0A367YB38_9ASCO|nr:Cell polarity protein alp11 [Candida viswanathii]